MSADTIEPSSPRLLYSRVCETDTDFQGGYRIFLKGTVRPTRGGRSLRSTSPVSALRGMELPLQLIRSFLKPRWRDHCFPMNMLFCNACRGGGRDLLGGRAHCEFYDHAIVEALDGYGGDGVLTGSCGLRNITNRHNLAENPESDDPDYPELGVQDSKGEWHHGKGCLYTPNKVAFAPLKQLIEGLCEETDADGFYLDEMEIRQRFYRHMAQRCEKVNDTYGDSWSFFCCGEERGKCGVLPGDTVFYEEGMDTAYAGYHLTRFEPASWAELVERGYDDCRHEQWAACFRCEIRAKRAGDAAEEARFKRIRESLEKWMRQEA